MILEQNNLANLKWYVGLMPLAKFLLNIKYGLGYMLLAEFQDCDHLRYTKQTILTIIILTFHVALMPHTIFPLNLTYNNLK